MDDSIYSAAINQNFQKYLDRLKEQLNSYSSEEVIWTTKGDVTNSAGNLAIHLLGNLNHFIGHGLGNTGYVRNRPLEFSQEFKSRTEIIDEIDQCKKIMGEIIPHLSPEILNSEYPLKFGDEQPSTYKWLIQCMNHFSYHLGQINYHRRLLDQ